MYASSPPSQLLTTVPSGSPSERKKASESSFQAEAEAEARCGSTRSGVMCGCSCRLLERLVGVDERVEGKSEVSPRVDVVEDVVGMLSEGLGVDWLRFHRSRDG